MTDLLERLAKWHESYAAAYKREELDLIASKHLATAAWLRLEWHKRTFADFTGTGPVAIERERLRQAADSLLTQAFTEAG